MLTSWPDCDKLKLTEGAGSPLNVSAVQEDLSKISYCLRLEVESAKPAQYLLLKFSGGNGNGKRPSMKES